MVMVATTPFWKLVPAIAMDTVLLEYPVGGVIVVIVGNGFVTVKASCLMARVPSVFLTVRLYTPAGRLVSGSVHLILSGMIEVGMIIFVVVRFVMITVALSLK